MAWDESVRRNHQAMREELYLAGGEERIRRQHDRGKLTARERMEALFDGGAFTEIEMLAKSRAPKEDEGKRHFLGDGVVCGYGTVDGRVVYAVSEDATISGGASGATQVEKMCRTLEQAVAARRPFVMLCESGGARIEEGILSLSAHSRLFRDNARASGYIPQIAAIMGNCAGGSSYSPAMCDFIFMVEGTGQFFITGPKVIKATLGMDVSMEELGGAAVHAQHSGQAHFVYPDDLACIEGIKELLWYVCEPLVPFSPAYDYAEAGRTIEDVVPQDKRRPYDVRDVIVRVVDDGTYMEVLAEFARNMVTCFARIEGRSVGIVANQAAFKGGALDSDAADKCARFVRFCDCFDVPLLTLVDVPGYYPGVDEERKGILRHGSKILYAFAEATVPQVSLILRKAYGGAYCAMDSKALGSDVAFAWPICEFAVMGAGGAVDVIYHRRLAQAEDPAALRAELIGRYEQRYLEPYYAAKCGMVDEVILPEETREKVARAFRSLEGKAVPALPKKHGNISL